MWKTEGIFAMGLLNPENQEQIKCHLWLEPSAERFVKAAQIACQYKYMHDHLLMTLMYVCCMFGYNQKSPAIISLHLINSTCA
jgi:hypothetical protein